MNHEYPKAACRRHATTALFTALLIGVWRFFPNPSIAAEEQAVTNDVAIAGNDAMVADTPQPFTITAPAGNLYFDTSWQPQTGLRLQLVPAGDDVGRAASVELDLGPDGAQLRRRSTHGSKPSTTMPTVRWRTNALPEGPSDHIEWTLKIRLDHWLLYCNDAWVAWFPAPFPAPLNVAAQTAGGGTDIPLENAFFQRVESWRFSDDFMIPETDDDVPDLGAWTPVSGLWHIHSVADHTDDPQRGNRTLDPEFSPNFYSMKGRGTNAVVTAGYDFYDHYRFSAAVEVQTGEMGLVFYYSEITQEYYAYTLTLSASDADAAQLTLWHTIDGDPDQRRFLAAARIPDLFPEQWIRMDIETRHDRIIARLDERTVFDIDHDLPGGGAFGFFADSDIDIIFDDVAAASVPDLDLRDTERIRFHKLAVNGDFFSEPQVSWWDWLLRRQPAIPPAGSLEPAVSDEDQWLVLGSPHHEGQVVSAMFNPSSKTFHAGWIAGLSHGKERRQADAPHYRFTAQRSGNHMIFRLFEVNAAGTISLLEQLRRPASLSYNQPMELKLDMSESRYLRFYCNNELVIIYETDTAPIGGAGPFVGAGTLVAIDNFQYRFSRDDIWTSSQEKNPIYLADPFMRHWSSPEGEWYTDNEGMTWHKSDFFGRFEVALPVVSNATVHLGVREGGTNGALTVTIRNGVATLFADDGETSSPQRLISTEMSRRNEKSSTNQTLFALHYEDHWLQMTTDGRTVLRHSLQQPLAGTRIRIEGFTIDDLAHSEVVRHNVRDHLFTEAPADWRLNGGAWRVVNRFQCDPRWSHMNAESADNLAAAWSKDYFEGDFSIEMYAGMRHGWYQRSGDMNITAMSRDGTASQGYTVTCTGWDPDHSQLDSVFYRNGKVIERTDAYLAPRHRAGNQRRHREEVVRAGRDVHGAWYYIKLRRIGNRLEYYFDNELILTWTDDDPIDIGRVGIWTFMNSIMIARVSISAQNHSPAPIRIDPIPVDTVQRIDIRAAATPAAAHPASGTDVAAAPEPWLPPSPMTAATWEAEDPVGQARMTWHHDAFFGHYFTMTTRLGGGPMFARNHMPPQRYHELAGWRFFLKRTHRANLNAYFTMGKRNNEGEYEPDQNYFHRISGTDFDRGDWQKTGATDVPGTAAARTPNWHMNERWRQVSVWLPTDNLPASVDPDNLWVRFEGFGVKQPSLEMQGLFGNGPGEAYAVARFTPVLMQPPFPHDDTGTATSSETNDVPATESSYRLYQSAARRKHLAHGNHETIIGAMRENTGSGLNIFWVESDTYRPGYPRDSIWLNPPRELEINARWCSDYPDTIVVEGPGDWPDRRLAQAEFTVNGHAVESRETGLNRRHVVLPPDIAVSTNDTRASSITLTAAMTPEHTQTLYLDAADPKRAALGPVLARLEGITPVYENFENLEFGSILQVDNNRMRIERGSGKQGAFVEIANRARGQRLQAQLSASLCLARYPLLQFDYRGDRMSFISLRVHRNWFVRMNESHPSAAEVRFASPFVNDGNWHTWIGMISEIVDHPVFNPNMYTINHLRLGSFHSTDQTGNFSRWGLANIVAGPAVATADQLAFTAHFKGLLPVESVFMTVQPGLDRVRNLSDDQLDDLSWRIIENAVRTQPDIDELPDGPAQLILRAVDSNGTWSDPVSIPFLLDRKAPQVTHVLAEDQHPLSNGNRLRLNFDTHDGAPVLLEDLRLGLNDQAPVAIGEFLNEVTLRAPGLRVELNWPHLLRDMIQQHHPGNPATLRISGMRDGAGNQIANIDIPIDVPDAKDTIGPAWLPATYPDVVRFNTAWKGRMTQPNYFSAAENNPLSIEHDWNEEPFLRTQTHRASGTITLPFAKPGWLLKDHPYLAFSVRQPALRSNNRARVEMEIKFDNKQSVRVSLTQSEDTDKAQALPEPIDWEANRWYSVILDVPKLMAKAGIDPDKRHVQSIAFERHDARNREQLDIKDLFVFGAWTKNDTVTIDAYDRSGIAGMEWEFFDRNDKSLSNHRDPREPAPGTQGWLVIRVRDRADNLSLPLRIPMVFADADPKLTFAEFVRHIIHLKPLGSHDIAK